jgi:NADH dehydrogenase
MQVFVSGGTGFVGSEVIRHLAAAGHQVVALVRPGSENKLVNVPNVSAHRGDVSVPDSLTEGLKGCDAVIHLVGIIREFPERKVTFERLHVEATQNMIRAVDACGIKRYLHMSANGTREDGVTPYQRSKWRAEEAVRNSQLDWTIFRPSMIFGPEGGFAEMLKELFRLPVVPVIGDGRYRLQPVSVGQVALTFLKSLAMPETAHETYHLGGAEQYTFNEILDLTGKALGRTEVIKLHQPVALVRPVVRLLENFRAFPLTLDQLTMLLEGNVCDQRPWAKTFGIDPLSFEKGVVTCFKSQG